MYFAITENKLLFKSGCDIVVERAYPHKALDEIHRSGTNSKRKRVNLNDEDHI